MTLQELFEISKNIVLTEKDKDMFRKRLELLDEQFRKEAESMRPNAEVLNRMYTL
ncbi:hypothetical protein [Klebsiella phage vB_Kpn_IME260]|uniref:Uncharacterized protein n=1 Tax=Klebsiella phage vB_Kpn_IME260 TaxID=1912318 RepID=A0A1L6Z532_9CAUD|nr:hypothetical protein FDH16_gp149 [Klebsiella phage vB_Kpn_IME260]APT41104.1 hypothetical protein [Klebsiella phage vB_Kpn_IME260]WEU68955.1 hypothetical protein HS371_65 [Klebsiella phage vB_KpP_HS37]